MPSSSVSLVVSTDGGMRFALAWSVVRAAVSADRICSWLLTVRTVDADRGVARVSPERWAFKAWLPFSALVIRVAKSSAFA
eukprot:3336373-Amphidinium_carterae.1